MGWGGVFVKDSAMGCTMRGNLGPPPPSTCAGIFVRKREEKRGFGVFGMLRFASISVNLRRVSVQASGEAAGLREIEGQRSVVIFFPSIAAR